MVVFQKWGCRQLVYFMDNPKLFHGELGVPLWLRTPLFFSFFFQQNPNSLPSLLDFSARQHLSINLSHPQSSLTNPETICLLRMVIGQTRGAPKLHQRSEIFFSPCRCTDGSLSRTNRTQLPGSRRVCPRCTIIWNLEQMGCKLLAIWIIMAMVSHKSGAKMDQIFRLSFLELDHLSLEAQSFWSKSPGNQGGFVVWRIIRLQSAPAGAILSDVHPT